MKKLIKLLGILFLLLLITPKANARCFSPNGFDTDINKYINADNVIIGKVLFVEDIDDTTLINIEVLKKYKGEYGEEEKITLLTPSNINYSENGNTILDCGYVNVKIGSVYSFYTDKELNTYIFSGNKKFGSIYEAIKEINTIVISSGQNIFSKKGIIVSDSCKVWYDGCNTCSRNEVGGKSKCTTRKCSNDELGNVYCSVIFDGIKDNPDLEQSNQNIAIKPNASVESDIENSNNVNKKENIKKKKNKEELEKPVKKINYKYEKAVNEESDRINIVNISDGFFEKNNIENRKIIFNNIENINKNKNKNSAILIAVSGALLFIVSVLIYMKTLKVKQEEKSGIEKNNDIAK